MLDGSMRLARTALLATVGGDGQPHIVPITFAVVDHRIVTAVDGKAKSSRQLKRLANVAVQPKVSVIVDHYDDADWTALWWVRVDGIAHVEEFGPSYDTGIAALRDKYAQYRGEVSLDGPLLVIEVKRATQWSAAV
jgi:PPOX class probable F420-dependent enzyme